MGEWRWEVSGGVHGVGLGVDPRQVRGWGGGSARRGVQLHFAVMHGKEENLFDSMTEEASSCIIHRFTITDKSTQTR